MAAKRLYDWDSWFSRDRFVLRAGEDFICSNSSMAQQVRVEAHHQRVYVMVRDEITRLVVEVSSEPFRNHKRNKRDSFNLK
jgi:hypothetical protein